MPLQHPAPGEEVAGQGRLAPSILAYPLLVLLLSIFAIGPALGSGYWWGAHDARHSVYFLFEFDQSIRDGIFWPRWSPDLAFGYGYPFFNIYGPLSSFVGEFFHLLGLDLVDAVKASFACSILVSGLTMYGFVRRLAGEKSGLVAALAYVYLPYHIADVYVRAALAESWALAWFPLLFWGFYECVTAPRRRALVLAALAYALLWLSHNGLAIQTTFLLMAWIAFWLLLPLRVEGAYFWSQREVLRLRLRRMGAAAAGGVLGVMVGAIFILPALVEYRYVNTDQWLKGYFSFTDHFVELWQLLSPYWGFGVSQPGVAEDGFPFQLGLVPLLFAVGAWVLPLREEPIKRMRLFFTLSLLFFLFLMLEPSRFIWESPLGALLSPMQFPWRFLVLAGFSLAVLAGLVARPLSPGGALLFALLLLVGSYGYLHAEIRPPAEGPVSHASLMRFQQSSGEMTGQSAWVPIENIPEWSDLADIWVAGGEVTSRFAYGDLPEGAWAGNGRSRTAQEIVEVQLHRPTTVRWMITYYPGWRAYRLPLEGEEILEELPITPQEGSGHLTVEAPAGHYRLMVRFEETPIRVVGKWLSLVALLVCALLLLPTGQGYRLRARLPG